MSLDGEKMVNCYYYDFYARKRPIGYRNFCNKYGGYFEKSAEMFSKRKDFDPKKFVHALMIEGFIYPQQFPIEKNWEKYERNKDSFTEENDEMILAKMIVSSVKELNGRTVEEYLKNSFNQFPIFSGEQNFSLGVFLFSKYFERFYNKNIDKFEKPINIKILRIKFFQYKRIIDKIKEVLKDDYYSF
jgi:hypothetical protein